MANYKKILCIALMLLLAATALVSCSFGGDGDYDDDEDSYVYEPYQPNFSSYTLSLLIPEETMYATRSYELEARINNDWRMENSEITYTIVENGADAVIENGVITASKAGTVRLKLSGAYDGNPVETEAVLSFSVPTVVLNMDDKTERIGDVVALNYKAAPDNFFDCNRSYITYTVLSGNAVIKTEGDRDYIVGREAGEVTVELKYKNPDTGVEVIGTDTLTFTEHGFEISIDQSALFVGYDMELSAAAKNIQGFDPNAVTYVLQSGTATLNGKILTATAEGTVRVSATYDYNGAILKSNELELPFAYDGNVIRTAEDLFNMSNSSATFNLLNDIDLSSYANWTPITGFTGTLRGNGHTISGLKITVLSLAENCGLFDVITGKVSDLKIDGTVTSYGEANNIGLLCGKNTGTVTGVTVSGSITAEYCSYVGGVAGYSDTTKITNCTSSVSINAKDYVGGIAGYVSADCLGSEISENNTNSGAINGGASVGGIFGAFVVKNASAQDTVIVTNHINNGTVNGNENVGGVLGLVKGFYQSGWNTYWGYVRILNCSDTAAISGTNYVGGIVGYAENYVTEMVLCTNTGDITGEMYVGGFAGYAKDTLMRSLTNSVSVTGQAYVGGIAGYAGKLESCVNNGTLTAVGFYTDDQGISYSYVGGLAGYATGAVNCTNNASIDVSSGGRYVGGIVGYMHAPRSTAETISNNINAGEIKGTGYVGGIIGYMTVQDGGNNDTIIVSQNKNGGSVIGTGNYVGGIFGEVCGKYSYVSYDPYYAKVKISSCENTASIMGVDYVGGIVGSATEYVSEISLCKNQDAISGNLYVGGFAGYAKDTTMRSLNNDQMITGKVYVGGIAGYAGKLESCENNGVLSLTGYELDANTEKISYVGGIAGYATGMTGCTNNATVDVSDGGKYVGGLVGYMNATRSATNMIENNVNNGEVKGTSCVGGVIGYIILQDGANNDVVEVKNNKNTNAVEGSSHYVGGVIGYANGKYSYISYDPYYAKIKITSCENGATVSGVNYVGGIVGSANEYVSEIALCKNQDEITGEWYVGGFAGYAKDTTMRSLNNAQTITGKVYVGGIAGYAGKLESCENNGVLTVIGYDLDDANERISYVGGVAGYATGMTGCTNNATVDVSDGGKYVGGLVGYMCATRSASNVIENNVNNGEVKGSSCLGGVIGYMTLQDNSNNDTVEIKSNKNTNSVEGSGDYVGGVVGYVCGDHSYISYNNYYAYVKLTSCENSATVTGMDYVGGIVGGAPLYVTEIAMCTNRDSITGNQYVGGFVGYASGTTLRSLNNADSVTGLAYVGGIAGYAGKLDSCEYSGTLTVTGYILDENTEKTSYVGGLAGYATGAANCTNNATVDVSGGGKYVGGLIGYLEAERSASYSISGNVNNGAVSGSSYVGGIAGYMTLLDGTNNDTVEVKNNKNQNSVVASGDFAGGIFGYVCGDHSYISYSNYYAYVKIISCSNSGSVSGADYVCGIAGAIGSYVNTETAIWDLNTVTGSVSATGIYTNQKYVTKLS